MKNAALLARRMRAVPRGVSAATPIFAARADNTEIWGEDGKRYIDFAGGIAVLNLGQHHPQVLAAIEEMHKRFGILFIADVVQSRFARTGKMFGIEHWPIKPDLLTVAQSLAGSLTLSGLIGQAKKSWMRSTLAALAALMANIRSLAPPPQPT